jgi:hypothetical protein
MMEQCISVSGFDGKQDFSVPAEKSKALRSGDPGGNSSGPPRLIYAPQKQ